MPLPSLRGHKEAQASAPQAHEALLPDNIPPEFRVLLSACRTFLGTEEPAKLEALLQRGPAWEQLLALASRHGVMPLLYRSISQNCPQAVPAEWLARLRMQYMMNAARNMKMTAELLRLLDLFEENGIEAIPYKGPALSQQIYGNAALRTFCDLDIIVPKKDVLLAKELLLKECYRSEHELCATQEKAYLRSQCEYNFNHYARGVHVEIHWMILPLFYFIDFDSEGIWSRIQKATLENRSITILSPEDLFIALCLHHAKHSWNWNQLKSVCDIAGLVHLHRNLDWKMMMSYARDLRIERIILLELKLIEDLLHVNIPEEISIKMMRDPAVKSLELKAKRHLSSEKLGPPSIVEGIYFWIMARERFGDNLECILRLAFQPIASDVAEVSLPDQLYPLYYLIHPIRLSFNYALKGKIK